VGNRKDFHDGWHIHALGALANSFDSTFSKWLMRQEDINLGWVIVKTCLYVLPTNTICFNYHEYVMCIQFPEKTIICFCNMIYDGEHLILSIVLH
jgi:hypothetical protein